jgi:hypothetical protein
VWYVKNEYWAKYLLAPGQPSSQSPHLPSTTVWFS